MHHSSVFPLWEGRQPSHYNGRGGPGMRTHEVKITPWVKFLTLNGLCGTKKTTTHESNDPNQQDQVAIP